MNKNLKGFADFLKKTVVEESEETYQLDKDELGISIDTLKDGTYNVTSAFLEGEKISISSLETLEGECMFLTENFEGGQYKLYYPYKDTYNLLV